ncbi:tandem-95 repeat protein [Ramlibacter terrae]|uniref:Tandem-95 repeat protein n=1 Tax=Ramlibacter terrae TaxID=2732511 RepID=A0ABX6P088_9BURK|nr:tandem-95 repeat protein [Ramlibacter terrae]
MQYTPDANWHGTDTYTYTVTSGGVTETATVTVTVTPVNDNAVFTGTTTGTTAEDGAAITGTLNATDVDGMTTAGYAVTGVAAHGTATIDAAGAWTYVPAADYNGTDSFTVTVTDNAGNTTTQVISLTVTAVADIAGNSVTVAEDGTATTALLGKHFRRHADDHRREPGFPRHGHHRRRSRRHGALHAEPELQRPRQLYLHGDLRRCDRDRHGYRQRHPGRRRDDLRRRHVRNRQRRRRCHHRHADRGRCRWHHDPRVHRRRQPGARQCDGQCGDRRRTYTPTADYNGADSFTVRVTDNAGNVSTRSSA